MITLFVILVFVIAVAGFYLLNHRTYFENIYFDENRHGFHALTSRKFGNPDGDSFIEYYHYYFKVSDRKIFVSKSIHDGNKLNGTLKDLKIRTKLNLQPNYKTKVSKLSSNQWLIQNEDYSVMVFLNAKRFGNCNLIQCRNKDQSLVFKIHV